MSGTRRSDARHFPFRRLFALAVLSLGVPPSEFWSMTPRELFALLEYALPPTPPDRAMLEDLIRRFGD